SASPSLCGEGTLTNSLTAETRGRRDCAESSTGYLKTVRVKSSPKYALLFAVLRRRKILPTLQTRSRRDLCECDRRRRAKFPPNHHFLRQDSWQLANESSAAHNQDKLSFALSRKPSRKD